MLASVPVLGALVRKLESRIGARLFAGFSAIGLLLSVTVLLGAWQMHSLLRGFGRVVDDHVPVIAHLQSLVREVSLVNIAARDALLVDETAADAALGRIESGRAQIGNEIASIQQLVQASSAEERAMVEELATQSSTVLVTLLKFSRLKKAGQAAPAKDLLANTLQPKMAAFAAAIDKTQAGQIRQLQSDRDDAARAVAVALGAIGTLLFGSLALAGLLAWRIARGVTRPVIDTVQLAESIAAGNLCNTLPAVRTDEIGRLQQAVLDMQHQLASLVGVIKTSAGSIASASDEIAQGSHHLSQRTEEAASSLARTSGAMDDLAGSVRRNAEAAREANVMATTTTAAAQRGGDVVSQVVGRMEEITQASHKIADITGVIDGIAFQTNILALNAAVEAARAGEHGRGFAVVAAEVRMLAQRAGTAAQEIKALIGESTSKVDAGSALVRNAGATMHDIVAGVERVTSMVDEICRSATVQTAGLGQVTQAVGNLDTMTQQNASLVEQSTAAAEGLRDQAHTLQTLVNRFRTAEHA